MITEFVQRWRAGRATYRPAREVISVQRLEVAAIHEDVTARAFVERHHYEHSYPAARFRFGLYERAEFVGVAVFSQPVNELTLACLPGQGLERVELGRLVLLDHVGANAETWFLGRCFDELRREGLVGIVSFSDPLERRAADGTLVTPGHVGTIYQAHNAVYLGRSRPERRLLLPDGTILHAYPYQHVRADDSALGVVGIARVLGALDLRAGRRTSELALLAPDDAGEVARKLWTLDAAPWWSGPCGWLLDDVVALKTPVPCRGAQGLWRLPRGAEDLVRKQWEALR